MIRKYNKDCKCFKCGHNDISDTFLVKGKYYFLLDGNSRKWIPAEEEMIERTCRNCGYQFYELPLNEGGLNA
jgi:transcription elongation factor Elf1